MKTTRENLMKRLDFLIGHWHLEVTHPNLRPSPIVGASSFEWMNEKYIIQRTHIEKAEFPSSTIVYDWNPDTARYVQHYFDSRGVTRLYHMSFEENVWKLWRDAPDFSPLDFHQRFNGKINKTGNVIDSSWEQSDDGITWEHDFRIVFRRTGGEL